MVWAISALSIALLLFRPWGISEAVWLVSGASLLVLLRLIPLRAAGHAVAEGSDVYCFLIGMMLLAELARSHGVFDWLSEYALEHAKGSPARLFTLIYIAGTAVTVLMSNDATAVVMTPAVLAAVKRAKTSPLPCLFVCALIANAASFVLPISNPANLVVFRQTMPSLGPWLAAFALPSAASIVATYGLLRWRFRNDLAGVCAVPRENVPLSRAGKVALAGIAAVAGVLLLFSAMKKNLGLPACAAAVAVAALVSLLEKQNPWRLVRKISWSILPLVAALFVVVEAIDRAGAGAILKQALHAASRWPQGGASLAIGFAVGAGASLVNNLPLGLLAGEVLAGGGFPHAWMKLVMIGVDLGPNLSVTGSLATILWLIALRREGVEVTGWEFLKTGLLVMPPALLLALGAALLGRGV